MKAELRLKIILHVTRLYDNRQKRMMIPLESKMKVRRHKEIDCDMIFSQVLRFEAKQHPTDIDEDRCLEISPCKGN